VKQEYNSFVPKTSSDVVLAKIKKKAKRKKFFNSVVAGAFLLILVGAILELNPFKTQKTSWFTDNVVVKNVTIDKEPVSYTILHLKNGATVILFNNKRKNKEESKL